MARTRAHIAGLSRLLASASQPVYALDAERTLVFANAACEAWLGQAVDLLLGRRCDYQAGYRHDGIADPVHALCPPPEALQGRVSTIEVAARDAAGVWQTRTADCLPLGDEATGNVGVLVIVQPADSAAAPPTAGPPPLAELHQRLRNVLRASFECLGLPQLVGASPAIERVRQQVQLAGEVDTRVLVIGPPGSGRETIARAIHYRRTAPSPLAPLACNLLDAELLESTITAFVASCAELQVERPAALLLLEVDQLPPEAQHALAGILSIGELQLRTLATARQSLVELSAQDRFRPDLAFALSTLTVQLPPLLQRIEDLPLLAQFFLERFNAAGGKQFSGFAADALDLLLAYPWPGNGDELAEMVLQACEQAAGPVIQPEELPEKLRVTAAAAAHPPSSDDTIVLPEFLAEIERELLQRALRKAKGNSAKAARLVGLSRPRFLRRLQYFGIE
jgi:transcriptional regulator of acetoin/glycerol metabolism